MNRIRTTIEYVIVWTEMLLSHLFIRINKTSGKTFNSVCTCTNVYIFVHFHLVSICNSPVAKQLNLIQIFLDTTLDHAKLFTHVYSTVVTDSL